MLCYDVQELEAEEYARKGVTLTPELWLVKLMVGAIDSRCVAPLCWSCLSDLPASLNAVMHTRYWMSRTARL